MIDAKETLAHLEAEYIAIEDYADRDDLVRALCELRDLQAGIRGLVADVTRDLLPLADERKWVVPGLGEVTVRKETKRTGWKHDELIPAIIARVMDEHETLYDSETGELLPYVQIGHNLTRRLRECVSFGAGKVTGLRAIGLQPDEWCHEEDDGWSVSLPPRETL